MIPRFLYVIERYDDGDVYDTRYSPIKHEFSMCLRSFLGAADKVAKIETLPDQLKYFIMISRLRSIFPKIQEIGFSIWGEGVFDEKWTQKLIEDFLSKYFNPPEDLLLSEDATKLDSSVDYARRFSEIEEEVWDVLEHIHDFSNAQMNDALQKINGLLTK